MQAIIAREFHANEVGKREEVARHEEPLNLRTLACRVCGNAEAVQFKTGVTNAKHQTPSSAHFQPESFTTALQYEWALEA